MDALLDLKEVVGRRLGETVQHQRRQQEDLSPARTKNQQAAEPKAADDAEPEAHTGSLSSFMGMLGMRKKTPKKKAPSAAGTSSRSPSSVSRSRHIWRTASMPDRWFGNRRGRRSARRAPLAAISPAGR